MNSDNVYTRRSTVKGAAVVAGLALGSSLSGASAAALPGKPSIDKADQLFEAGGFRAADAMYWVLAGDPDNVHALAQHAYVTVLANRLPAAKSLLKRVLRLDPRHSRSLSNLADVLWRQDAFDELASILPLVDKGGPSATVGQLKSFARRRPYQISGPRSVRIPFLAVDPLPMIEVSLNGAPPEVFFLDTGGKFALNQKYAEELDIPMYGYTADRTMYGEHKAYQGRVDLLTLGDVRIRHLPVHTIPEEIRLTAPDGRVTKGAIGTSVLSHFLSTIDYPGKALVLRRKQHFSSADLPRAMSTPMWFLGSHFLLSHGTVNDLDPMVFFVDTGGGDIGFTAPRSTFKAAKMPIPPGDGLHPVTMDKVTLGPAVRRDLPGLIGAFPQWFEDGFGFHIGGLPTHQFFKPYGLTLDFDRMRILMST
ncbi:aspartyl protease family protein [Nonomuraea sp. NPDC046570]|uniref:aspartyl protease family protein n=1 Tax=Nonomuraea sp. NPDC046570 TaxID=3155255 RepID=UPI003410DAD7